MSYKAAHVPLADIVRIKGGKRLPAGANLQTKKNSHPYIRVRDIGQIYIPRTGLEYVPDDVFPHIKNYIVEENDVVISIVGTIGAVSIVDKHFHLASQTENCAKLSGLDSEDAVYLYYYLISRFGQQQIKAGTVGAVQPKLPLYNIAKLEIYWPEKNERKRISNYLKFLDNKIELNRQTNQTLEQIAQALFKSWFVDFEPTRAKIAAKEAGASPEEIERAAMCAISGKTPEQLAQLPPEAQQNLKTTAALFPDALMDSELGEIPAGWEVKSFGDVSNCFDSKRVPLSKPQREKKKPGDYPYYGATSVMDYVNEWIFDGIYLLLGEDGSVAKEDGTPFTQYVWGKTWVNNHAHVLQGKDTVSTEHLMLFIQTQNIAAYITGAVQQKLNQGNMNSIPFIFADRQINEVFFQSIKSLYAQIRNLTEEIQRLENLRKLLLPKLLSGEIGA